MLASYLQEVSGTSYKLQEKVLSCYNKLQKQATDNKQQVVYRFPASAAKQVTLQQVTGKSYVNHNQLQQVTAIYRKPVIL